MARWRLLRGIHSDKDAKTVEMVEVPGVERPPLAEHNKRIRKVQTLDGMVEETVPDSYYPGDVFDSGKDLLKTSGPRRFELLDSPVDKFDVMTIQQLRDFAAGEEIELPEGKGVIKAKILQALRGALQYQEAMT